MPPSAPRRRHAMVAASCVAFVAVMVGLSFAAVPLYDMFCRVTGFGGTTQRAEAGPDRALDETILVRFDSNVASGLPWRFRPKEKQIRVRIGETVTVAYEAENIGDRATVGTSTYNVSPSQVGLFFSKLECFCFQEQPLEPGETVDMPVVFYVDPAILEDTDGRRTREITLSYTFYPAEDDERDESLAASDDEAGRRPM